MKKILVIDRDEKTTGALQRVLESEAHKVFIATTMKETIALLNAETFDMVILSALTTTPEFDVVKWLLHHSTATKVIVIAAAGATPSPHANVVASVALPLDWIALKNLVKINLMENGIFGVLNDISLADYIQLICMKNATKGIRVSQQNDKGLILIRDGKVMYAAQDNLLGMEAFFRIMSWKKGSFREVKVTLFPPANIDKDYRHLLFEAAGYEDEANRHALAAPARIAEKIAAEPADGGKTIPTATRNRLAEVPVKVATKVAALPVTGNRPADVEPPSPPSKTKKQRLFFGLAAIVPVLLLIILLQSFSLTDRSPLPAFATPAPSPISSRKTAQFNEISETFEQNQDTNRQAGSPSITIGPLHNSGDYEVNNKLAKIRAETVAEQLRARGIVVSHIASGGEELPVASNLSLAGRKKNRRVEV